MAPAETPRRKEQWTPRFAGAWAALVFALCTLALGFPALGGGFLINASSDQFKAGYPFREFAAASLEGRSRNSTLESVSHGCRMSPRCMATFSIRPLSCG
jgi:hypothetical protein